MAKVEMDLSELDALRDSETLQPEKTLEDTLEKLGYAIESNIFGKKYIKKKK
jgi:hypothetical protein